MHGQPYFNSARELLLINKWISLCLGFSVYFVVLWSSAIMWPKRAMLVETKSFLKSVIYMFCVCNLCFQITVFKRGWGEKKAVTVFL